MKNSYEKTEFFQLMFDQSDDAVFILDSKNFCAIDSNKSALLLFGYDSISEVSEETFTKLLDVGKMPAPFLLRNYILDIKTSITFKRKYYAELGFVTKNGETFIGEITISSLNDKENDYYLCIIRDITVQKYTSMIQKFMYDLNLKDRLNDKEMSQFVVEKALELTMASFAFFAYIDQSSDKLEIIGSAFKKGVLKKLPESLDVERVSLLDPNLLKLIEGAVPDRMNGVGDNLIYVPVVTDAKTVCFLATYNKPSGFTQRELDVITYLMQSFWPVLQRKMPDAEEGKQRINLEKMLGTSRNIERLLRENQDRFKKLVANMSDEVWVFNREGNVIEVNESASKHMQFPIFELLKLRFVDICPEVRQDEFVELFDTIIERGSLAFEGKFIRKDGSWYDIDLFANYIEMDNDKLILCTVRDITVLKNTEVKLFKNEKKYRIVLDQAFEMILLCELEGSILEVNEITCKSLGYKEKELIGQNIRLFISDRTINYLNDVIASDATINNFELTERVLRKDGSRFVGDIKCKIIGIDSETYLLFTIHDVAEEIKQEEKIRFLNFHDKVSGLYNKAFFEEELKKLDLGINLPISIIMGDINGLKMINSTYGHSEGDRLISTISYILLSCCRAEDIVARWGGDEFVILLPNADEKVCESIVKIIESVCREYKDRVSDLDDPIDPSISFGYATKQDELQDINEVMKKAEDFMYKRKMLDKKSMHSSIVHSMRNTLFEKNFDNAEYSDRLSKICRMIGQKMGLPDDELNELELLSVLHDVGKIVIDAYVLNKDDALSEEDWKEIRKHPEVGYRILKSAPELASVAECVLSHHERWDGTGYPNGLVGEAIPLKSRIMAVADAYSAMTQQKSYRKAMQVEQAKTELVKNMNTQFDEKIVKIFLEILEKEKSL